MDARAAGEKGTLRAGEFAMDTRLTAVLPDTPLAAAFKMN